VGSIPSGVIEIFHWHNPSDRTTALGLTQPQTEMGTMNQSFLSKFFINVFLFINLFTSERS